MVRLEIDAKVKPGKQIEFAQIMAHVKTEEESRPGGGRVTIRQDVREPALHSLLFEWETYQDFESYLETEGMAFLQGGLIVLCDNAQFSITPRSRKYDRMFTLASNARNYRQRRSKDEAMEKK